MRSVKCKAQSAKLQRKAQSFEFYAFVFRSTLYALSFIFALSRPLPVEAVDCSRSAGGNVTISSSCTFPASVDGADAGTGTSNTAVITVGSGTTLTVSAGQTVAAGSLDMTGTGTVAIVATGQIKPGSPLWMYDADADGYPKESTMAAQSTQPPGHRRRNLMTSMTQRDCQDFYNSDYNCQPVTGDLSSGTHGGTFEESSGTPALSYRELAKDNATVGLWHMNEASGTSVADSSGNANTGTATGTTVVAGKLGNGRSFAANEYINTGSYSLSSGAFTIEAWVYKTARVDGSYIIGRVNAGTYSNGSFYMYDNTLNQIAWACDVDASNRTSVYYSGSIPLNTWTHLAVTGSSCDAATSVKIYVNGVSVSTVLDLDTGAPTFQSNTTMIGNSYVAGAAGGYFPGRLDEVRVSNVARTPEEIKAAAQRRPYAVYTAPVNDLGQTPGSWTGMTVQAKGVRTGDGETPHSTNSLVAAWNFNETSGTTATNNATAVSCGGTPSNCNGTLTNFASTASQDQAAGTGWTANNRRWGAGALMFDGSNDSVSIPDGTMWNVTDMTIEAWVLPSSTVSQTFVGKWDTSGTNQRSFYFSTAANNINLCISKNGTDAGSSCATASKVLSLGSWHHIATTYDFITDGSSVIKIYVDGQEKTSGSNNVGPMFDGTANLNIGTFDGTTEPFKGTIDSTRIYSRALSAVEVLANYQAGNIEFQTRTSADNATWEAWKPVTNETALDAVDSLSPVEKISQTSLTAYWKLDETSGSRADSKGTNTLTDNNTVTYAPGRLGNAGQFVHANSEYLSCTDITCPDFSPGNTDFTITLWAYFDTLNANANWNDILNKAGPTGVGDREYLLLHKGDTNRLRWSVTGDGGTTFTHALADNFGPLSTNTWYFIIVYHDAVNDQIGISVNNGAFNTAAHTTGVYNSTADFTIGKAIFADNMNGRIDEVAFWKRTLTAVERTQLFEDGLDLHGAGSGRVYRTRDTTTKLEGTGSEKLEVGRPQVDSSTVGLWHLEETSGSGPYIKDSVPRGFNPDTNSTLSNNLMAYWKLEETSGTRYDFKGSNHLSDGNTVTSNTGKQGTAAQFTAANSEYLSIADNADLSTGDIDFTITAWVYLDSISTTHGIVGKGRSSAGSYEYKLRSTTTRFQLCTAADGGSLGCVSADNFGAISTGTWYFIVAWFNASANTMNIQVNNGAADSASAPVPADRNGEFIIGCEGICEAWAMDGRIDEVGFWKKMLTAQEKTDLYNSGTGQSYGPNHGTPTGTTVVDGFYGKARHISGNDATAYMSIPNTNLQFGTNNFTVDLWFKRNGNQPGSSAIFSKYQDSSGGHDFIFDINSDNTVAVRAYNDAGTVLFNSGSITTGTNWNHFALVRTGNTGIVYFNGVATYSGDISMLNVNNTQPYYLGKYADAGTPTNYNKDIYVDEVRISNVARSAEEIAEGYRAGRGHTVGRTISSTDLSGKTKLPFYVASDRPGTWATLSVGESAFANYEPDANTVGLWHLEEQTGTANTYIRDSSSYGGDSDVITGTTFVQGKLGKARNFDGTDDVIRITEYSAVDLGATTDSYTVEAWFQTSATYSVEGGIVSKNDGTGAYPYSLVINNTDHHPRFTVYDGTNSTSSDPPIAVNDGKWHYLVGVRDVGTDKVLLYLDGQLVDSDIDSTTASMANNDDISVGNFSTSYTARDFNGTIDEVRISNTARSADEIRQTYEVGKRTHPITIDFVSSPQAAYSSGTSVTVNNPWGTSNLTDTLSVGDTMIFKENVGGTETVSQATVNAIANTTSTYGTVTLAAAPTFPTGGYTTNATVFKWQREYFDITGSLGAQRDAVTRLTLRVTNGHEGRTVWLDDFKSASYINRGTCDTLNITTGVCTHLIPSSSVTSTLNRYFQTRMIFSSWDPAVSATLTSSQIEYGL